MKILRCLRATTALALLFALSGLATTAAFAQAPAAGTERQQTIPSDPNYRFGMADVLQIDVWGRPDLSGTVTVDLEGRVQIPLVGEVRAEGVTADELARSLIERYQLVDPSVSEVLISVVQYNANQVTILGEVRGGGPYGFREMPDLIEALMTAGGPTAKAELAMVQIVRADPVPGEPRSITVDLSRGLDAVDPSTLPELRPRDRILVPSSEDVPVGGDKVHVLGAVNSPGPYRISAARNVIEAISTSGGFRSEAALDKVYLTRVTSTGTVAYRLDIEGYLKKAQPLSNMELMPGDTITVMEKKSIWEGVSKFLGIIIPFASLAVTIILASN